MAGNPQLYTLLYLTVDNTLLVEHASLDVKRTGGGQIVGTVAKGFAGISPGMKTCTIDVTNAVPAANIEYDAGKAISEYIPVEMGVVGPGGKTAKATGFIMSDDLKHALNQESTYAMSFIGDFPLFE
jgi:hypothetical protein